MRRSQWLVVSLASAALLVSVSLAAQQPARAVTAADYARAEKFLAQNLAGLVIGGSATPELIGRGGAVDERFVYRTTRLDGTSEKIFVDPAKKLRQVCTAAMPECANVADDPAAGRGRGRAGGGGGGRGGGAAAGASSDGKPVSVAPDGRHGVFIRDWNLWARDMVSGQERQLTTDGQKYFGYATDNAGWSGSDRAIVSWAPDSKQVATQQQDERQVGEMYLVPTVVGHPTLRTAKFPLPGDPVMAMIQRVVIDVDSGRLTRLQMPPDFHRATLGDDLSTSTCG